MRRGVCVCARDEPRWPESAADGLQRYESRVQHAMVVRVRVYHLCARPRRGDERCKLPQLGVGPAGDRLQSAAEHCLASKHLLERPTYHGRHGQPKVPARSRRSSWVLSGRAGGG
eukprot:3286369-Prymnesium_polylepis.1